MHSNIETDQMFKKKKKKNLSYYKHLYWINMEVIPHGIQDTQLCFDKPEELF